MINEELNLDKMTETKEILKCMLENNYQVVIGDYCQEIFQKLFSFVMHQLAEPEDANLRTSTYAAATTLGLFTQKLPQLAHTFYSEEMVKSLIQETQTREVYIELNYLRRAFIEKQGKCFSASFFVQKQAIP